MAQAANIMRGAFAPLSAAAINGTAFSSIAATGSTQTDAAAVTSDNCTVTAADGTKGVRLPAGQQGDSVIICNNSASTLKVYPPTGAAIAVPASGMGSANAAYSHTTFAVVMYVCNSSTQWYPIKSA